MNKNSDQSKEWSYVIREVNLKAGKEILDPNESDIELIQENALEYLENISRLELIEEDNKPVIGFDEEIDFDISKDFD